MLNLVIIKKLATYLLLITFIALQTHKINADSRVVETKTMMVPQYLFHWTKDSTLKMESLMNRVKQTGQYPFHQISSTQLIGESIPGLAGKEALFVWTNPVTGMGAGVFEMYGNVPVVLETVNYPVKVAEVVTEPGSVIPKEVFDGKGVQLIHHKRVQRDSPGATAKVIFEEWIIIDKTAVREFSSAKKDVRPHLIPWLHKLRDGVKFAPSELHFKTAAMGALGQAKPFFNESGYVMEHVIPRIEKFLLGDVKIPEIYERVLPNEERIEIEIEPIKEHKEDIPGGTKFCGSLMSKLSRIFGK